MDRQRTLESDSVMSLDRCGLDESMNDALVFLGFNLRGKEDSFSTSIMNVGAIVFGDSLGIYYYLGFLQRLRVL